MELAWLSSAALSGPPVHGNNHPQGRNPSSVSSTCPTHMTPVGRGEQETLINSFIGHLLMATDLSREL